MNDQTETEQTETVVSKNRIKRIKIAVTQKEIDEAHEGKSNKCMIHEAIKRDHPNLKAISVDKNNVRFTDPEANVIYTFQMSAYGRAMLLLWDDGKEIAPFDLWLREPIVRERRLIGGVQRVKSSENSAKRHHGAIPRPLTKEAKRQRGGRDRVFGQKLWNDELAKLRNVLQ